jgi:hypothetical protein
MKNKILIAFLLIFFITAEYGVAQSSFAPLKQKNLEMYWFYRHRLKNMFMKMGPNQGESLPAAQRNLWLWDNQSDQNYLKWGDTTIDFGFYLGTLATEYRLLLNNGELEALEKTKTELYYALKAVARLDENAECIHPYDDFYPNVVGCGYLNGYFIRDDVPTEIDDSSNGAGIFFDGPDPYETDQGFVQQNLSHFNNEKKKTLFEMNNVFYALSDYSDSGSFNVPPSLENPPTLEPNFKAKEMSQDQMIPLIMGLILVNQLTVDHNVSSSTVLDLEGNVITDLPFIAFRTFSSNQVNRMMDWARNNAGNNDLGWHIKNPELVDVWRGPDFGAYAWGMNRATDKLLGFDKVCTWFPYGAEFQAQPGLADATNIMKTDNRFMSLITGALSDAWTDWFGLVNKTEESIFALADKEKWQAFYIYLNRLLYPNNISESFPITDDFTYTGVGSFSEIFSTAPCKGPNNSNSEVSNWKSSNRFIKDGLVQVSGGSSKGAQSGLDYMLIHNLYYLVNDLPLPYYEDIEDRHYSNVINSYTDESYPNNIDERNIIGISSLTANNIIIPASLVPVLSDIAKQINYKANDYITLEPGFVVTPEITGDLFTANIVAEFECDNGGYYRLAETEEGTRELIKAGLYKDHKYIKESVDDDPILSQIKIANFKDENTYFSIEKNSIKVFPNPNDGLFAFEANNLDLNIKYEMLITDVLGRIITYKEYSNVDFVKEENISERELSKGTYFLVFKGGEIYYTEKIIVQ